MIAPHRGRPLFLFFLSLALLAALISCNSVYTPKPRGYFRISLPEHAYQPFDRPGFPYRFDYPVYGAIIQDSTYFEQQPENPYWINVDFPRFHARFYISYIEIGGKSRFKVMNKSGQYVDSMGLNSFDRLISSSYNLTYKHTYKASSIEDSVFSTAAGIHGIYFKISGNAATANQFLVTDSVKHFLRGALYFEATPNEDSLSVVNQFLQADLKHLISTFRWK